MVEEVKMALTRQMKIKLIESQKRLLMPMGESKIKKDTLILNFKKPTRAGHERGR